jgi:phosphatidylglycerophosphate synthase
MNETLTRRPIRARDTRWAAATARGLAHIGLRPNAISLLSILCAAVAFAALLRADRCGAAALVVAALFIQLRLLCNLFDGMVAVEGGFKSKTGELYNEFPDRISDALILFGAGIYAGSTSIWLGVAAAFLAVLTAYIRTLGAAAGAAQVFCGPMAKQQRMFIVTAACLVSIFLPPPAPVMEAALWIIIAGCIITIIRRARIIAAELNAK